MLGAFRMSTKYGFRLGSIRLLGQTVLALARHSGSNGSISSPKERDGEDDHDERSLEPFSQSDQRVARDHEGLLSECPQELSHAGMTEFRKAQVSLA